MLTPGLTIMGPISGQGVTQDKQHQLDWFSNTFYANLTSYNITWNNVTNNNGTSKITSDEAEDNGSFLVNQIQLIKAIVLILVISILILSTCKIVLKTFSKYAGKRDEEG